jgi:hypothetical protein
LSSSEGDNMPKQGAALTKVEKEMIRQWVLYGAKNTGTVVSKALITQFYDVYGIKAFPDGPPARPVASEGFQLRTGPFFLPPSGEQEYYLKHSLNLPNDLEVNRLDMQFPAYSHHFILYNFETTAAANAIPNGLRTNAQHNAINLVAAVQEKTDLKLPATTAFRWPKTQVLDMNTHYINYSLDHPFQAEVFTNVYTQPTGTAQQEMHAELFSHFNWVIPNNGNLFTSTGQVFDSGSDSIYVWGLMGHTHKYGVGYKIWERNGNNQKGSLLYDASCAQGIPGCPSPYFDYQHIPMRYYSPSLPIDYKKGFIHEASWKNDGPVPLTFGPTSNDEMMVMIALYTEQPITSDVDNLPPATGHNGLMLMPNPAQASVLIGTEDGQKIGEIRVLDMSGRTVLTRTGIQMSQYRLDLPNLPAGVYAVRTLAGVAKLVICE